ncbi:MAG: MerR family transcriptional regulator, partial [Bacillota bacterium]
MTESSDGERLFRIGEAAERTGVSTRTLRYYEELELLRPTESDDGGYRLYSAEDLHRLRVIATFKELGFTLAELRSILSPEPGEEKEEQLEYSRQVLHTQMAHLEERMQQLRRRRQEIREALQVLQACGECSVTRCPPGCSRRKA